MNYYIYFKYIYRFLNVKYDIPLYEILKLALISGQGDENRKFLISFNQVKYIQELSNKIHQKPNLTYRNKVKLY